MIVFIIFGILLGALTVIFALQNVAVITVTFLTWQITGSLSAVLFCAAIAGVIVSLLISVPEVIKNHLLFRNIKRENARLQAELDATKKQLADANAKASIMTGPARDQV